MWECPEMANNLISVTGPLLIYFHPSEQILNVNTVQKNILPHSREAQWLTHMHVLTCVTGTAQRAGSQGFVGYLVADRLTQGRNYYGAQLPCPCEESQQYLLVKLISSQFKLRS